MSVKIDRNGTESSDIMRLSYGAEEVKMQLMKKHYQRTTNNREIEIIEKCIKKLDAIKPMSKKEADTTIRKLYTTIDANMPEFLYKFRSGNTNDIENLKQNRIFLCAPKQFNDPAECAGYIDMGKLFAYAFEDIDDDFEFFDEIDENEVEKALINDGINMDNMELIKRFLRRSSFLELAIAASNHIESVVKIGCLSENIFSTLMWAHYANEHKGFAVRYDLSMQFFPECQKCKMHACNNRCKPLYPVIYKDKRCDIGDYAFARACYLKYKGLETENELPTPFLPIIQKQSEWKYEHEWRIVCKNIEQTYLTMIPDAIVLGCRIDTSLRNELLTIAKEKNLKVFEMSFDSFSDSFDLEINSIEE